MKVQIRNTNGGELLESHTMTMAETQTFIDLFKHNDYLDKVGNLYQFDYVQLEPDLKACIYLINKDEVPDDEKVET